LAARDELFEKPPESGGFFRGETAPQACENSIGLLDIGESLC
jgi:hypothetical protein